MSNEKKISAIGLDIGGTKIAAGVVLWPSGEVLHRTILHTNPSRGGEAVLQDTFAVAAELYRLAKSHDIHVAGIGAGVAELIDCDGNVTSDQLIRWRGTPVRQRLSQIAPTRVDSDVRAAALAEATFGAGMGHRLFIYITVGTGISYCLVQDGRPFIGARGNAISMGSSPLSTTCTNCKTKLRPVLEEFASGPAVARRFAQANGNRQSKMTATQVRRAEEVFCSAESGDSTAAEILSSAGEALGVSTAFLINVLDPEIVVIGGGLANAGDVYWKSFECACREHIFADNSRTLPIVRTKLGNDTGLVGAAATVFV